VSTNVGGNPYGVNKTQTTTQSRPASLDGEILVVHTLLSGAKVLVDYGDRDDIVELQLYRRVRLIDVAAHVQQEFGVHQDASAIHITLPYLGNSSGFSFDGSARHAVPLQCLPNGQVVHVLPDVVKVAAGVRLRLPVLELASRVAVLVAA
jgi:hypothetical protein